MTQQSGFSVIRSSAGVTIVELLMAIIISSIAFMALAVPFVSERTFWIAGKAQTESQRSAQVVLRAIARVARESKRLEPGKGFLTPTCGAGKEFSWVGEEIQFTDRCSGGPAVTIATGVTEFNLEQVVLNNRFRVRVHIRVRQLNRPNEDEILDTEIYLRNGSAI